VSDGKGGSASSLAAGSEGAGARRNRAPIAIGGSNDEIRILLRGILRLHRYPVAGEAMSPGDLGRLPSDTRILIYDVARSGDVAPWTESVSALTRDNPGIQVLALLPYGSEGNRTEAERTGALATLVKPFKVQDLLRSIDALLAEPGTV
jgi:DNA-binding NtrC family response regulator